MKAKLTSLKKKLIVKPTKKEKNKLEALDYAFLAIKAAEDKKGKNILLLDVSKLTAISDYFLIVSAESNIQVQAIANFIDNVLLENNYKPLSREGFTHGAWIILDYGDIVIHIMHEKEREYYKLERFWSNATIVNKKIKK